MSIYILGIESSCDDTAAAIIENDIIRSNITAGQEVHRNFGGVVPELASRAHQQNIIPVIETAIKKANISKNQLSAVAFTRGPGLLGSLLVGISFAKAFALGLQIPCQLKRYKPVRDRSKLIAFVRLCGNYIP